MSETEKPKGRKIGREWRPFIDQCAICGGDAEVLVRCDTPASYFMEGDEARCTDCRIPGFVVVDDEDDRASIRWHECIGDKPCEWCKMRDEADRALSAEDTKRKLLSELRAIKDHIARTGSDTSGRVNHLAYIIRMHEA